MSLFPKINLGSAEALPGHDRLGTPCEQAINLPFPRFSATFDRSCPRSKQEISNSALAMMELGFGTMFLLHEIYPCQFRPKLRLSEAQHVANTPARASS
jgi:hypothetical protein